MKRLTKNILSLVGMGSILVFCVGATVGISSSVSIEGNQAFPEALNMFLLGFGIVGLRSFFKIRMANR